MMAATGDSETCPCAALGQPPRFASCARVSLGNVDLTRSFAWRLGDVRAQARELRELVVAARGAAWTAAMRW